ncbi:unnamed protein product [Polarella glacialis]|uniref:5'-Nucleotidase C-terminal domain-containing protein n=1 Tax=Polarella glacialis TaxID=89957 RepID=A0A813LC37_POLGL|nr:unnamed protein product [Polarella glacialis]
MRAVASYQPDQELAAYVHAQSAPLRELEGATLYELADGELLSSAGVRNGVATMARLLATAIRESLCADAALINSGAVRGEKEYAEVVTFADLKRECPFPSEFVVVAMPADVLLEAIHVSRQSWGEPTRTTTTATATTATTTPTKEAPEALQVDFGLEVTSDELTIRGQGPEAQKLYQVACDVYDLSRNPVLKEYCARHPARVPPADAGRAALPCPSSWSTSVARCGGSSWMSVRKSVTTTLPKLKGARWNTCLHSLTSTRTVNSLPRNCPAPFRPD